MGESPRVNQTLAEWLGYEREELLNGKRFVDLLTVGGRIFFETHFNLLLRVQNAVDEIALDIVRKDGRVLPTLINARQKRDLQGEPLLNRFTIFNASERRLYERDLLAARDLLKTTLASIGDAVVATDAEGRITFTNPVADVLSGWSSESALGRSIDEVLIFCGEETGLKIENPIWETLRSGNVVGLANHTILVSKDGKHLPVDDSASPIKDADGRVIGSVLVFRDISGRRRAEKELENAYQQLKTTAAELQRSNEDLSQFSYVASHDLRSPLNTILQFTELLEREYGAAIGEGKALLDFVKTAARRMDRLIEDLLSYARFSQDTTERYELIDTTLPLQMAIENLRSKAEEAGATITYDSMPFIRAHETGLLQIFQNLIGNAIHYRGPDPPRIHVSATEHDNEWLFSCADNGMGIPLEFQSSVFAPFKRLHGADRPGSGIGLAVCKKLVERHKGKIWVQSENASGSTFFFTIAKT